MEDGVPTMAKTLNIEKKLVSKGAVLLQLRGVLDAHTFDRLGKMMEELLQQGQAKIVLDLNDVEYMSSSGAGVIITLLPKAQAQQGNIVLLNPTDQVHQVLSLLGITDLVPVELSQAAAMEHF
jgi:anti-sigma B factor antagonist